ncbi:hypothetical protein [Paenibacillus polymyxa]|uniref:hypothetical protein n=1 Tax=Paenibacillus polymyxa TaxID=1406 RepID=UPI00129A79FC|nr:hypothetical protein [Paenibacillus polymyxa]MCJ1222256.1 hypothetical protein [Paenibacillus polymyxa]
MTRPQLKAKARRREKREFLKKVYGDFWQEFYYANTHFDDNGKLLGDGSLLGGKVR